MINCFFNLRLYMSMNDVYNVIYIFRINCYFNLRLYMSINDTVENNLDHDHSSCRAYLCTV